MSTELASRMSMIKGSPTSVIVAKVAELKEKGVDIISLNVGEPDFPTPAYIRDAVRYALDNEPIRYTTGAGILPLRQAICDKLAKDNGITYDPKEILISVGAKQALYSALMAIAGPGDEIIIPTPCYVSYPEMVRMTGATVVTVPSDPATNQLDIEAIRRAVTPKTKALIICSPSNPTGVVYEAECLKALADLAVAHDFFVLADEIYEKIIYGKARHVSIASFNDEIRRRTITINGFSKSHAMTGWRIGYAAGPQTVITAMTKIQSQITTCVSELVQKAALAALTGPQDDTEMMRQSFETRRDYVTKRLAAMPGISFTPIDGAFYVLFNVEPYIGRTMKGHVIGNDVDFCEYVLGEAHVAMVPGSAFEAPGHIRISYATSMALLEEAMNRLERVLM
ncbi:MAG: pyridoxal phosphate-dependent aminotransferase [Lachnospiraceae bacterium]|nr:pyridoxal phosphate-dependent aminotransferase [Lachnospiraceae bacterium]